MNNLVPVGSPSSPGTLLPVAIDYPAALALRQMALVQDELPKYLLAPEVSALLHYVRIFTARCCWRRCGTPARALIEALALTRGFFTDAAVSVRAAGHAQTARRESGQDGRSCSRRQSGPSSCSAFRSPLRQPATDDGGHLKIPLERRNKHTGRIEKARIWEITDRTVRTWLSEAVEAAAADGGDVLSTGDPHTFRHSYAMHMLYAGIPLKVLQSLMGHKSISSTEVYTKVFALDVAAPSCAVRHAGS